MDEPEPGGTHRDLRGCTLEPAVGFEPTTYGLQNRCTTAVLCWRQRQGGGAEASVRTRKRHRGDTRGVRLVAHPRHQAGSARLGPLRPDSQTTLPSNGSRLPAEPRCTRQSFGAPAPPHERNDSVRTDARPRRSRAPDPPRRCFALSRSTAVGKSLRLDMETGCGARSGLPLRAELRSEMSFANAARGVAAVVAPGGSPAGRGPCARFPLGTSRARARADEYLRRLLGTTRRGHACFCVRLPGRMPDPPGIPSAA